MTRTERSARKKLKALVAGALANEPGLADAAKRRIVNRILRRSEEVADIGRALGETAIAPSAASSAPVRAEPTASVQVFDPYAIGAVVTLQRHGAEALRDRLSAICNVEHLVSLATAQNLAVNGGWSNADELRTAIVQCAEQRLAERRAAAS